MAAIWAGLAAAAIGGGVSAYSAHEAGKNQGSSTSEEKLPPWLSGLQSQLAGQASGIAGQGYTPYGGDRVAGLTGLENSAIYEAGSNPTQGYLQQALEQFQKANPDFTQGFDAKKYMNPYIQSAMRPAIRDTDQRYREQLAKLRAGSVMRGAFGGSRQALLEGQLGKNREQEIGDITSRGYASAFDDAASRWGADRSLRLKLGEEYAGLGDKASQWQSGHLSNMLQVGGMQRGYLQSLLDDKYGQFRESQDYPYNNLNRLTGVFGSLARGPGSTTTTTSTGPRPNPLTAAAGGALAGYGLYNQFAGRGGSSGGNGAPPPSYNAYDPNGPFGNNGGNNYTFGG